MSARARTGKKEFLCLLQNERPANSLKSNTPSYYRAMRRASHTMAVYEVVCHHAIAGEFAFVLPLS